MAPAPEPVARDQHRGELPVERLTRIAESVPATGTAYKPTPAAAKLAGALLQGANGVDSFVELAEKAGISRRALYDLLDQPKAVAWIVANSYGTRAASAAIGLVHNRLLNLALTDRRPAFIELYLRRFDPEFHKEAAGTTVNISGGQFAFLEGMSNDELRAYLEQKRRQIMGAEHAGPSRP